QALAKERLVLAVAQKDHAEDTPEVPGGVHRLGTICLILRQRKLPDGRVKVLVQGLLKGTLEEVVEKGACARARISRIHELPFELQARLQSQAKEEISKTQREYYLREQVRQIQHELGVRDEKAEMVQDLRKEIDEAGLPKPALDESNKELRRLEAMSLDSAEAA